MTITIASRVVLGVLGSALVACSPIQVRTDYDPTTNFSSLRTYAWLQKPSGAPRDPRIDNDLLDSRVRAAVNEELYARGYREASASPDFRVTYHVMVQRTLDVQAFPVSYGYGLGAWGPATTDVRVSEYDEGTLLLDVVGERSNELLWRGSAQARIDPARSPEQRTRLIQDAVHEMLDRFPPPR